MKHLEEYYKEYEYNKVVEDLYSTDINEERLTSKIFRYIKNKIKKWLSYDDAEPTNTFANVKKGYEFDETPELFISKYFDKSNIDLTYFNKQDNMSQIKNAIRLSGTNADNLQGLYIIDKLIKKSNNYTAINREPWHVKYIMGSIKMNKNVTDICGMAIYSYKYYKDITKDDLINYTHVFALQVPPKYRRYEKDIYTKILDGITSTEEGENNIGITITTKSDRVESILKQIGYRIDDKNTNKDSKLYKKKIK